MTPHKIVLEVTLEVNPEQVRIDLTPREWTRELSNLLASGERVTGIKVKEGWPEEWK